MSIASSLLAFSAAASVLTVTPGLDTALVLRTATVDGPRPALCAKAGIAAGCLVWGAVVAAGLGALLATSEAAFATVRIVGALYLLWTGLLLITRPGRQGGVDASGKGVARGRARPLAAFGRGFLTNLLNPKIGLFYVTFLPQFVPGGVSAAGFTLLLALIHVCLGIAWLALLAVATIPAGRLLARPVVVRTLDRLTGCIFIAFAAKLALSQRD